MDDPDCCTDDASLDLVELTDSQVGLLPYEAADLLESLQGGDGADIAEPSVYPHVGAFSYHAIAYLHNAKMLCQHVHAHDFAVFTALYCIRHGLELWLKCIAKRKVMDDVLEAMRARKTLDEIAEIAMKGSKTTKAQLIWVQIL